MHEILCPNTSSFQTRAPNRQHLHPSFCFCFSPTRSRTLRPLPFPTCRHLWLCCAVPSWSLQWLLLPTPEAIRPRQDLDPANCWPPVVPSSPKAPVVPPRVRLRSLDPPVTPCCCPGSTGCAPGPPSREDSMEPLFCFTKLRCFICKFGVLL